MIGGDRSFISDQAQQETPQLADTPPCLARRLEYTLCREYVLLEHLFVLHQILLLDLVALGQDHDERDLLLAEPLDDVYIVG